MIQIYTDTTSSLTFEDYEKYGIKAIPLYVNQGETSVRELFDISYDEFYTRQRSGVKFTTSQPDPQTFLESFRSDVEAGNEIICILLTSGISGSTNTAELAKQMLDTDRISIFDSGHTGFSEGYMAIKAAEMAKSGASVTEIMDTLKDLRSRTRTYFMVESLRYLYEGGRLSGAQALIGSVVQIKPIIWFNAEGKMTSLEKVRTLKAAKTRLLELTKERAALGIEHIILHYAQNLEEATEYVKQVEEIAERPVRLVQLSPVIGTHAGPDLLGICMVTNK